MSPAPKTLSAPSILGGMIARYFGFLGCVNVLVLVYLGNRDGFGIAAH